MSFYLKEMGMIYSFGDFKCTQKDDFGDFFLNTYGIKYQVKELVPNGWNWGAIHVDSRVFAMLEPDDPDDLEDDEDYAPEEQQEGAAKKNDGQQSDDGFEDEENEEEP